MIRFDIQLFGGRGASSGKGGGGGQSYRDNPEYKEEYDYEMRLRLREAVVPSSLASNNDVDDEKIEVQMRGYATAIGDPIRAMENQKASIAREYADYKDAKSPSNLGTKEAMEKILGEYDDAIARMKRIKKNSKRPDLL